MFSLTNRIFYFLFQKMPTYRKNNKVRNKANKTNLELASQLFNLVNKYTYTS